jgi:hypothetical protein
VRDTIIETNFASESDVAAISDEAFPKRRANQLADGSLSRNPPSVTQNSQDPLCTGCLLEAMKPFTLEYPFSVTTTSLKPVTIQTEITIYPEVGSTVTNIQTVTDDLGAGPRAATGLVTTSNDLTWTWWGAPSVIL